MHRLAGTLLARLAPRRSMYVRTVAPIKNSSAWKHSRLPLIVIAIGNMRPLSHLPRDGTCRENRALGCLGLQRNLPTQSCFGDQHYSDSSSPMPIHPNK